MAESEEQFLDYDRYSSVTENSAIVKEASTMFENASFGHIQTQAPTGEPFLEWAEQGKDPERLRTFFIAWVESYKHFLSHIRGYAEPVGKKKAYTIYWRRLPDLAYDPRREIWQMTARLLVSDKPAERDAEKL